MLQNRDMCSSCERLDILFKMYIIWEALMQVAKWGNSLAVRLPSAVVDALELKEGDQIEIRIAGDREFEVSRDRKRKGSRTPSPAASTAASWLYVQPR
jgi:antitoxin component of MazEF toxin-antitoxin module